VTKDLIVLLTLVGVCAPLIADEQGIGRRLGGENGPRLAEPAPGRPVPRLPNGTVDLGGVWRNGGDDLVDGLKPGELVSLMLPWAKAVYDARHRDNSQDPYSYCMPGGPLRIGGGFAWRFVPYPMPNVTHIFILQEGNAHTYRQIFMDGRPHPEDPTPGWYGHSIGRWEGDTLVIDTVGLHDKFWLDEDGAPHTEQLHMIERWTRNAFTTLDRAVTIDDPGTYTRPFTVHFTARLAVPDSEIMEYYCIENNQYGLPGAVANPYSGKQ
jgi:hypothetical protein